MFNTEWPTTSLDSKTEHQKYYTKGGILIPGVTTVLGVLNKQALIHWSADLERKELMKCFEQKIQVPDKLFYLTMRDTAASIGTLAHFMCECWIKQRNPEFINYDTELIEKAKLSFEKFKGFWESGNYKMVKSEVQLVSEVHRYGGTIDIVAMDGEDNLTILDIKTSKKSREKDGLYSTHKTQLAAYRYLWNENNEKPITHQKIVRIGKDQPDDMDVVKVSNEQMEAHLLHFMAALDVYRSEKEIAAL